MAPRWRQIIVGRTGTQWDEYAPYVGAAGLAALILIAGLVAYFATRPATDDPDTIIVVTGATPTTQIVAVQATAVPSTQPTSTWTPLPTSTPPPPPTGTAPAEAAATATVPPSPVEVVVAPTPSPAPTRPSAGATAPPPVPSPTPGQPQASHTPPPQTPTSAEAGTTQATVVQVVSGDTLQVDVAGTVQTVRLIGADAPEPTECYGREAAARLNELVAGQTISLVQDVTDNDPQGNLLRYAFVGEIFVNAELVRGGFAAAADDGVNVAYAEDLARVGRDAQSQGAGLWGACGGPHAQAAAQPTPQPALSPSEAAAQPQPTATAGGTPPPSS